MRYFLIFALLFSFCKFYGQNRILYFNNSDLVYPTEVNKHFTGQTKHYLQRYEKLRAALTQEKEFLQPKNKKIRLKEINLDLEECNNCLQAWQLHQSEIENSIKINMEEISIGECYDLKTPDGTLSVLDYEFIPLDPTEKVFWTEFVNGTNYTVFEEKKLIRKASGQWVRKKISENCLSSDPADCYVACWETIPAEYEIIEKKGTVETCPEGYEIESSINKCSKINWIVLDQLTQKEAFEVINLNNEEPILIEKWEKTVCDN